MSSPVSKKSIFAAVIGNALEWYDFLVFAFMTPVVAKLFFPIDSRDPSSSLNQILLTTAVFGVGFFMRPIGGIVLGRYGDKHGRKAAMVLITGLMALAMVLITCAPTYERAGLFAPVCIVVARLIQGFAAGGEFGASTALLIELAPEERRGFYGAWQMTGQMLALLVAATVGTVITDFFRIDQVMSWAWRLPFAFGLLIVPVAFYIRRHVEEPDTFRELKEARAKGRSCELSVLEMLATYRRETLVGMSLVVTATVSIYITFTYLVTFSTVTLKLPLRDTFLVQMAGAALMVLLTPFMGAWSDRVGRRKLTIWSLVGYLVMIYPLYSWLVFEPSVQKLLIVQLVICVLVSAFFGVFSTVMAELFPADVRSVGMSMAYNIAVMVFGGFAQFIVTWLIRETGSPMSPAYYVLFGVGLGAIAALFVRDLTRTDRTAATRAGAVA